jgi:hypothetical protein
MSPDGSLSHPSKFIIIYIHPVIKRCMKCSVAAITIHNETTAFTTHTRFSMTSRKQMLSHLTHDIVAYSGTDLEIAVKAIEAT